MKSICSPPEICLGCFSQQEAEPLSRSWPGGPCRRHQTIRTEHHSPARSDSFRMRPRGHPRRISPRVERIRPAPMAAVLTKTNSRPAVQGDGIIRMHRRRPSQPLYHSQSGGTTVFQKEDLLQSGAYQPPTQGLVALPRTPLFPPRPIFPASMLQVAGACQRPATLASHHASPPRLILAMLSRHRRRSRPRPPVVPAGPSPGPAISWQS